MGKRDLKWIELLRTFGMFFIVICHAQDMVAPRGVSDAWWPAALSSAVRFAVPLFFIISGYLVDRGLGSADGPIRYSTVFRRRIAPVIVNFLAWNVIYMVLMNVLFGVPVWSFNTLWLLTTGYIHLYFIFVLMQLFLLYPLVHAFLDKRSGVILVAAAFISLAFYVTSDILLWTRGADGHFFEWHWGKLFAGWCVFFFWGVWLARRPGLMAWMSRRILLLAALAAISFIPFWVESYQEMHSFGYKPRGYFLASGIAFQFLCANLVLACAHRLDIRNRLRNRLVDMMVASGIDTYGIYLSHYSFLLVLAGLLNLSAVHLAPPLAVIALSVAAFAASQGFVRAMRSTRTPALSVLNRLLFGHRQ